MPDCIGNLKIAQRYDVVGKAMLDRDMLQQAGQRPVKLRSHESAALTLATVKSEIPYRWSEVRDFAQQWAAALLNVK